MREGNHIDVQWHLAATAKEAQKRGWFAGNACGQFAKVLGTNQDIKSVALDALEKNNKLMKQVDKIAMVLNIYPPCH